MIVQTSAPRLGSPLHLDQRSAPVQVAAVAAGTALLALGSWAQVPMVPVPMTMQTFAVTLVGALFGARLGTLTVLLWLAEALLGLPVLAGGKAGLAPFVGPTAGYLMAFPIAAWCVGRLVERGWQAGIVRCFAAFCIGNALCLAIGGAWLAVLIGVDKAWAVGVAPFVLGGLLKSALGVSTLAILRRVRPAPQRA